MADEPDPEMIRRQMEAQRASLADKIETLENKIVRTVENAREAVAETVETVKDSVQSSVETVKDTVQSSVDTVKETFDVRRQVERHPWAMFGGSIAVGFVAGCLLNRLTGSSRTAGSTWGYVPASYAGGGTSRFVTRGASGGFHHEGRAAATFVEAGPPAGPPPTVPLRTEPSVVPTPPARAATWLDEMSQTFAPELQQLKGLAIGAAMGVVRDLVTQSVPDQLRAQVNEMIDNVTTKLGGEPVQGHLLDELLPRRRDDYPNGEHRAPQLEPQA
jgi:ElaB/YqjD/DUF883 family membrane-anchored ribosome-binding protein